MFVRIASALIALPFVIWLIHVGGWPFMAFVLFVALVCAYEFFAMTMPGDRVSLAIFTMTNVVLVAAFVLGLVASPLGVPLLGLVPAGILVYFLFRIGDMQTVAARASFVVLGLAWTGLMLAATASVRLLPEGRAWFFLACVLAWGSDTGAYFVGRFLGRHKLYERVSPKKTWEGALGGVVVATLGAFVLRRIAGGPEIGTVHLILLAALAAAVGQIGDLAESLLKRSVGVKDSGRIMPGHGGLFDRVDALIFLGPVVLADAVWFHGARPVWLSVLE